MATSDSRVLLNLTCVGLPYGFYGQRALDKDLYSSSAWKNYRMHGLHHVDSVELRLGTYRDGATASVQSCMFMCVVVAAVEFGCRRCGRGCVAVAYFNPSADACSRRGSVAAAHAPS